MSRREHKKYYPPMIGRGKRMRKAFFRILINLLAASALAIIVYIVLSSLFDMPAERRMRQANNALRREYEALEERLAEVEGVLGNVADRDRSVFHTLFESEPYSFSAGFETSRWQLREKFADKTNRELAGGLARKIDSLRQSLEFGEGILTDTYMNMMDMENGVNNIPSIQPVINGGLTLLTASFGERIQPYYKALTMHEGVDYTVPEGTRVFATADGVVKIATIRPSTTGTTIVIDHGNGYETVYSHLSGMIVRSGQYVRRGDIIAMTGDTGLSLMPHLHYEVRFEGNAVDPVNYFFAELGPKEYDRIKRIAKSGMQSFD